VTEFTLLDVKETDHNELGMGSIFVVNTTGYFCK